TEFDAELLGLTIEVVGDDCRIERPVVHGQGKVMSNHGNFVGPGRLRNERGLHTALGTLQVFENHDGDLRAFRRTERRVDGVLRESDGGKQGDGDKSWNQNSVHGRMSADLSNELHPHSWCGKSRGFQGPTASARKS